MKLVYSLFFLVLILVGVIFSGGYFIFIKLKENKEKINFISNEKKKEAESIALKTKTIYIDSLTLNILDSKNRAKLIILYLIIEIDENKNEEDIKKNIIDKIIFLIDQRNSEELQTIRGKEIFLEEIQDSLKEEIKSIKIKNLILKEPFS